MRNTPAYNNDYSWTKLVRKGRPTKYVKILQLLVNHGPMSKRKIVEEVWNKKYDDFSYCCPLWTGGVYKGNTFRGWNSHLFSCMHADGLIDYVPKVNAWFCTPKGLAIYKAYRNKYEQK